MKQFMKSLYYSARWTLVVVKVSWARLFHRRLVFILGTANHTNIGDLAITLAEIRFIEKDEAMKAISIDLPTLKQYEKYVRGIVRSEDIISTHGGGNIGDTYPRNESMRRFIFQEFRDMPVLVFPQTIHFSSTPEGEAFNQESVRLYAEHPQLTIIAREQKSYQLAKEMFSANNVILTPDIVLSSQIPASAAHRSGVVTCLRVDVEKTLSSDDHARIMAFAKGVSNDITQTDTMFKGLFFALRSKRAIVERKFAQFQRAELVITDRLHGMVFAAITGTPCIVFSNFNYKVRGTYEWIKHLGYIKYCESVDEMEQTDIEELKAAAQSYDPSQFEEYWKKIAVSLKPEAHT